MISVKFSRSNKLFKPFLKKTFICLFIFCCGIITAQADTINKSIGGTVYTVINGQQIVIPGATVILKLGTGDSSNPITYEYRTFVTDGNGYYGPTTKTFYCGSGYYEVSSYVLLDNGQLQGGVSASGGWNCLDTNDWSNMYWVGIGDAAQNNPQNAGDSCNISVGEPVNISNGNMWLKQSDYVLPGIGEEINITRTYNSMVQRSGVFGIGWTSEFDEIFSPYGNSNLYLSNGQILFLTYIGNNTYQPLTGGFYGQMIRNSDATHTLTYKDGRVKKFNTNGKLIWIKDRNGNQTTINWNSNGTLGSVTDASGRSVTFTYNYYGKVEQMSDATGIIANYEYNTNNNSLKTVTYADGSKYKFEYDTTTAPGKILLKTVKDALDNVLETHEYDSQGRATTSEKHGGVEKYTLDYAHILDNVPYTTVTDALGRVTKYYFDKSKGRNVVTKTEGNCNCGNGSEVTTYEYDDKLNLKKKVDALNRQTTYTYDANGNRLSMTDVLGTETFTYNSLGQILTATDRMGGAVAINTYDSSGNLLTTKDALNNTTTLTYTAFGQPATIKDALNRTTTLIYDAFGRLTQVKDANNKTTNYAYDARAKLTSATNALNETTAFEYDPKDRLKKVVHADTHFITYAYDLAGRRTAMTDERGNTTNYGYDQAYRLTSTTDALNHTTAYGYDLMSNPISQTDALNQTTNYEYDNYNLLKKTIYPPSVSGAARLEESLTYDLVGNVKTRTDTAGRQTLYDYDTANRLIKTTDALSQITQFEYNARSQMTKVKDALNQEYGFTYDALGRQLSQTRASSTMSFEYDAIGNRMKRTDYIGRETTYEYDVLNRLKKINYLSGNQTPNQTASYNYDDLSRLINATNESGAVSFTYDSRGRVKTSTDVFNHLIEYNYDAASNRTQLKLDSNVHTTYAYDVANRLTTLTDEASQNFTFGYDIANRLISKTLPNNITTAYNYDGMSRLTRLKHQSSTAILTDNNYAYNPANQISQIAELAQTKNFSYDSVDRLTAMNNGAANENYTFDSVGNRTGSHLSNAYTYQPFNRMSVTSTATMNYDANGNLVSKSQGKDFWRFGWDYENRMVSASTRKETVRYSYDALGRRVQRYFKGGKENTKFIYDGLDVLIDNNGGVLTKYQNGLGIDDKLKVSLNGNARYFLQDHLGSTVGLTDASGNLSSSANYDSFGNSTNNLSTRYQFTGREKDDFTGLYFYRARWYDSNLGRFISEDPIGFAGGSNWFAYVGNNPLNLFDPYGLAPNPRFKQKCESWKKTIENIEQDIKKRIGEMAEDREGLPWRAPNDSKNPASSRWGHQKIINELKARKAELEGYVNTYCNDDDNSSQAEPATESCPIKLKSPLNQPTMDELRMQIEYHQQMEQFWTKVLVGSVIGGAVYLAPPLITAALPQLPRFISQTPRFAY